MNAEEKTTNTPVHDLDPAKIGAALIGALESSSYLGHVKVANTVRDYVRREHLDPEGQFVYDVLTGSTAEARDRWLGGEIEAAAATQAYLLSLIPMDQILENMRNAP